MRKAGGVLTIIGGIIGIGIGAVIMGEWLGGVSEYFWSAARGGIFIAFAIVALIVGIVALIGGIYALRARVWGFALAGGIVGIGIGAVIMGEWFGVVSEFFWFGAIGAPLILFGILGTIFIALRKEEFE